MKITKSQLKKIIKEELSTLHEVEEPETDFEIYSMLLALDKQAQLLEEALERGLGLYAEFDQRTLTMSDNAANKIYAAKRAIRDARQALSKEIGQDPHPELRSVRGD